MTDTAAPPGADSPHVPQQTYNDRPSPFTICELAVEFDEPPASRTTLMRLMPVGTLITNLISFADFYKQATSQIDSADVFDRRGEYGI